MDIFFRILYQHPRYWIYIHSDILNLECDLVNLKCIDPKE